jgi:hypothetical protein
MDCPRCGRHLSRAHRTRLEKFVYSDMYRCLRCEYRIGQPYRLLRSNVTFITSRHTRCIRCGTIDVHRSHKRDRIDPVSNNPLSWLMRLFGAPVVRCTRCRLQYYDFRRPEDRVHRADIQPAGEVV